MPADLLDILRRGQTAAQASDRAGLERALSDIDVAARDGLDTSALHFVRGRFLIWLDRDEEAMSELERAIALDAGNAHARFHRGVLLAEAGRESEAYEEWARAATDDPSFEDAAYNAGQAAYNLGRFDDALRFFAEACRARPDDFEAYKKLVQALRASGRDDEAERATVRLVELWSKSGDPAVQKLNDVVIDQFKLHGHTVLVYQNLRPVRPELHYEIVFSVSGQNLTVQLESSAYGRERGVPYLLGMTRGSEHRVLGPGYGARPPYVQVKAAAMVVLDKVLAPTA